MDELALLLFYCLGLLRPKSRRFRGGWPLYARLRAGMRASQYLLWR